jgi:ABC-type multidrug transport system fused ATPase/permease subunit
MSEGRTTFVIVHELRLVRSVDSILVIEDGSVVETGTHEDLVSSDGLYARLYSLQERDPVQP